MGYAQYIGPIPFLALSGSYVRSFDIIKLCGTLAGWHGGTVLFLEMYVDIY